VQEPCGAGKIGVPLCPRTSGLGSSVTTGLVEDATFVSFDGGVSARASYCRPDSYRMIEDHGGRAHRIARGGGYSYAAASFGAGSLVLDMTRLNRVLRFDPPTRLIEAEAGITLGGLFALTAPRGLWLPVQPGYPDITIGGCIAANVHGKNPHREGTFEQSVVSLTLYHPERGTVRIDRESEAELFELTCGGYGLTGIILAATLRLEPLPGPVAAVCRIPIDGLAEGLERVRALTEESAFAYTWHEGTPSPRAFGRGFVFQGRIAPGPPMPVAVPPYRRLVAGRRGRLPISVWGRRTTWLLAGGFRRLQAMKPDLTEMTLFDAMFPFARRGEYFLLYGQRGLAEYQALVPPHAIAPFLQELEGEALRMRAPLVMLSMKLFRGSQRFLRFEGDGICFTADLVRSPAGLSFLPVLDRLTVAAGGIPNIIKDSRLPVAVVRQCYPEYECFREKLRSYDPGRRFRSELSERLEL
jgi:decaprenylphospho-beta-D-ribofuranose 2-oxidase